MNPPRSRNIVESLVTTDDGIQRKVLVLSLWDPSALNRWIFVFFSPLGVIININSPTSLAALSLTTFTLVAIGAVFALIFDRYEQRAKDALIVAGAAMATQISSTPSSPYKWTVPLRDGRRATVTCSGSPLTPANTRTQSMYESPTSFARDRSSTLNTTPTNLGPAGQASGSAGGAGGPRRRISSGSSSSLSHSATRRNPFQQRAGRKSM